MDLRQLPALNAIKAFEAAARHESFSRAADELFVTHGAVSHQIRALEAELGVSLLSSFAARWVTPRIGSFIEAHPQWDLELLSTNALTDFARDDVDVAIRF